MSSSSVTQGTPCCGRAAFDESGELKPFEFKRRNLNPDDVKIDIEYCGVCHSDLHTIRNEWSGAQYPIVPGHEIVGRVVEVGKDVKGFKVGDLAGVGCMVNSCKSCEQCSKDQEQFCLNGCIFTYNATDKDGSRTQGGYSQSVVVTESFVLHIPDNLALDGAAPLLCAGITTYSPMVHHGMNKPGLHIGVVGLGGLGHMAVKFGKAFGCKVTVLSTSPSKEKEARTGLGADDFLVTKNEEVMKAAAGTFDGILDTVSAKHDIVDYLKLLKPTGTHVCVGLPNVPYTLPAAPLVQRGITLAGSLIGGVKETQEMLDFCGKHNIVSEIELIKMDYINEAIERLANNDPAPKYRFVIDIKNSNMSA